jgi:hypothetical protein
MDICDEMLDHTILAESGQCSCRRLFLCLSTNPRRPRRPQYPPETLPRARVVIERLMRHGYFDDVDARGQLSPM